MIIYLKFLNKTDEVFTQCLYYKWAILIGLTGAGISFISTHAAQDGFLIS